MRNTCSAMHYEKHGSGAQKTRKAMLTQAQKARKSACDRQRYLRNHEERLRYQREYYAEHKEEINRRRITYGFIPYGTARKYKEMNGE